MKTKIVTTLPGQPIATLHLARINPAEPTPRYKVTGHTITTIEMTADQVMERFFHFDEEVDEKETSYYLTIVAKDDAHIELSKDIRHGNKGFRANRYELANEANQKREWDETPLFFATLDEAIAMFAHPVESDAYEEARRAARMRF